MGALSGFGSRRLGSERSACSLEAFRQLVEQTPELFAVPAAPPRFEDRVPIYERR